MLLSILLKLSANRWSVLLIACFGITQTACERKESSQRPLRLGYSPADETLNERQSTYESLRDYLSSFTGYDFELVQVSSYEPAILAMKSDEIDVMNFGSQAYLIAEERHAAEAFALRGTPAGAPLAYHSVLVARAGSVLQDFDDVVRKREELSILFTNPASTSGYLVALSVYQERGIDPLEDFGEVSFTNSHALSIFRIANGQGDVAHVSSRILERLEAQGKIDPQSLKVIWTSNSIPHGPIAYRPSLDPELKSKIREAYLSLPTSSPDTWKQLKLFYPDEDFVYIPYQEKSYESLRTLRAPD